MNKLAGYVFAIVGSQIYNERGFSAAGVMSRNRRNRIGIQNINSRIHIYHKYLDEVASRDSAPSFAEIVCNQDRSDTLKR